MTKAKIMEQGRKAQIPYTVAAEIRELLDKARKEYGPTDWDDDDIESKVAELVFEE